ncbi:MAG: glycosyltransferase family 39 protein [Mariniphaga sp.]|nr:glycosyltransferase family 39 protein [Mariniphaga sp.]
MIPKKKPIVFLLLIITSVILRFYSFFPAVMDHDESTYLIIGRDLAQGKQMYTDVMDTKPVGIFLIYSFFHYIFGYSIFLTRLFVAVMIGATAHLIYLASIKLINEKSPAFAAAIIYLFYTSIWTKFGVGPNAELFFNLTTISGFFFFLKHKKWSYSAAGLLFGIGFMIKYLVLFDFIFLSAFFLIRELSLNKWRIGKTSFLKYVFAGIGFSIPFLATNLYFYLGSNFEAFKYITYELPSKYGQGHNNMKYLLFLLDFLVRFLPISIMLFYALFSKVKMLKKWQLQMFLFWIVGILIAMYLPGKNFGHYSIQLMIPLSLITGLYFHPNLNKGRVLQLITGKKYGIYFLLASFLIVQISGISSKIMNNDKPRQVAEYLNKNKKSDETLYLSNYKHIVYYLLRTDSPTKYVHPTLLSNPSHAKAIGIDGKQEIRNIIENNPTWVVMYDFNNYVKELIKNDYNIDTVFSESKVEIYKISD